jgi:type IV secretion system protein VirB10
MNIPAKIPEASPGEQDPRPIVALPRQVIPGLLFALIGIAAAVLLFLNLDAQRRRGAQTAPAPSVVFAPPPPLAIPAEPVVEPKAVELVPAPAPAPPPPTTVYPPELPPPPYMRPLPPLPPPPPPPETAARPSDSAPALVVDSGASAGETSSRGNSSTSITAGTLIPAVLETPIDTAKPGLVRAVVSQDTRGSDGRKVLVPRGSRLIGEYQSDIRPGQDRVLVNWTRLIRPDGLAITLTSPAADAMGGAGIPGRVNSFFLARFFDAALQTALTVAGNLVARPATNTVIVGLPNAGAPGAVAQAVAPTNERRPKIKVKQGTVFNVFVARDLDVPGIGSVR